MNMEYQDAMGQEAPLPDYGNRNLTIKDLPPPGTTRWVVRRKAAVVAGVRQGLITLEEACHRYTLSVEEFLSWQRLIEQHGERGLRVTRLKDYRPSAGDSPEPASAASPEQAPQPGSEPASEPASQPAVSPAGTPGHEDPPDT